MAKSELYLRKIESYKANSVVGFRLKQTFYNAMINCHKEGIEFEYQNLLEKYCIPTSESYILDEMYYKIMDGKIIPANRNKKDSELFLEKLAKNTLGKVVFNKDKEPMLMLDGFLLRASAITENTFYTEEYTENFNTPYDLFPRIINIKNGQVLVETEKEVCEWQNI